MVIQFPHIPPSGVEPSWEEWFDAIPQLELLSDIPQEPDFHGEGNVLIHTKMAVCKLLTFPAYIQAEDESREVMFLATLLHDLGKLTTTKEMDGRIRSLGHPRRGAIDARIILWLAGIPAAKRERICRIIRFHHTPYHAFSDDQELSPEYKVRKLSHELNIKELIAVCLADAGGRICKTPEMQQSAIDNTLLFETLAQEEGCLGYPYLFPDDTTQISYFRSSGTIYPGTPFFVPDGSMVTVMSGLPAAGKDTWIANNRPGLPVVSFDNTRLRLGLKHGVNEGLVAQETIESARVYLRKKAPFVWSATNISIQMRQKTLDLLYDYHAKVGIISLDVSEEIMRLRNHSRSAEVPQHYIESALLRWEPPLPTEAHSVRYF